MLKLKSPAELGDGLGLECAKTIEFLLESFVEYQEQVAAWFQNVAKAVVDADLLGLVVVLNDAVEGKARGRRDAHPEGPGPCIEVTDRHVGRGKASTEIELKMFGRTP